MRRKVIIGAAMALLVMSVSAATAFAQKADFSGTWTLDRGRSEGVPPGMEQTMTIKQAGDRLEMEMKVTGGPQGDEEIKDEFILDSKEVDYRPTVMRGVEVKRAKRTSKWSADGKGFDTSEDTIVDGPEGMVNFKITRHWQLSEDGKTLTIDMTVEGPRGARKSKRVYAKK